nr:MAG TPA: hypothetical protein [Caudoviricetes sp.]
MKNFRKMTIAEIKAFDGTKVIRIYSDFDEKVNGHKTIETDEIYPINAIATSNKKYLTDDEGLYVVFSDHEINTEIDLICKGHGKEKARQLATYDVVTVTNIYKAVQE